MVKILSKTSQGEQIRGKIAVKILKHLDSFQRTQNLIFAWFPQVKQTLHFLQGKYYFREFRRSIPEGYETTFKYFRCEKYLGSKTLDFKKFPPREPRNYFSLV